jgi:hypothetical protein
MLGTFGNGISRRTRGRSVQVSIEHRRTAVRRGVRPRHGQNSNAGTYLSRGKNQGLEEVGPRLLVGSKELEEIRY